MMPKRGAKSGGGEAGALVLEQSPSHLLHRALQHALDIYADAMDGLPLTQRQFAVLFAVAAREGLTQTDLVHATGIDRSTLADLVARMLAKDLLARERSSTDGRANTVRLAEAGRAALLEAGPRVAAADARIMALLPAKARDGFLKTLGALSAAAEAVEADIPPADAVEPGAEAKPPRVKAPKPEKADKAERAEKKKKKKLKKAKREAEPTP